MLFAIRQVTVTQLLYTEAIAGEAVGETAQALVGYAPVIRCGSKFTCSSKYLSLRLLEQYKLQLLVF